MPCLLKMTGFGPHRKTAEDSKEKCINARFRHSEKRVENRINGLHQIRDSAHGSDQTGADKKGKQGGDNGLKPQEQSISGSFDGKLRECKKEKEAKDGKQRHYGDGEGSGFFHGIFHRTTAFISIII